MSESLALRQRLDRLIDVNKIRNQNLAHINYSLHEIVHTLKSLTEALIDLAKKEDVEGEDDSRPAD